MPKVLHIGPCDSPGGMANVMRILAEHPPEGWDAELLSSHVEGSPWAKWRAYRRARAALAKLLNDANRRPDIVHLHTAADWSWWRKRRFAQMAHKAGVPNIVHIHSGQFDTWLGAPESRRSRAMSTDLLKFESFTVVLNEYWKLELESRIGKVQIINNPVSPMIQAMDTQRDSSHLLLLGRNDPVKGHEFAIKVCQQVRNSIPNLRVTMSGIQHSPHDWISCVGWVDESEKLRLLQTATLLLVPSEFEGQPLVVLEALTCGLQVLASDRIFSVPQSVVQVPFQDMDEWVINVQDMLETPKPSSILRKQADSFSIENTSKKWLNHYSSLLVEHE
jgi:glycosyltransferase involved in cell wall biosynthesis